MQHTGEKPYLCTLCPKMFTRLTYLKDHMNSHSGQKVYLCPHCSETFSERSDFTRHVKTHKLTSKRANRNTQQASNFSLLFTLTNNGDFDELVCHDELIIGMRACKNSGPNH